MVIQVAFKDIRDAVGFNIYRKFPLAAARASEAAIPTVNSWIRRREEGGLTHQTFRATCIRE
jgi:hypothetical protein